MNPVVLVDSYAQIYRGFYAVRALSAGDGTPTNAVFAMARFLLKLHADFPDSDGAFVFDLGRPAHRLELAPDYKANRPPTPPELKTQLAPIREMIRAFGWPVFEHEAWEADDLISALTRAFPEREFKIVSADKDLAQLVNERVEMLVPSHDGKGFELRDIDGVRSKFSVEPSQIVDYLALIGDAADNIPGIDGVGPKTAAALIRQFGSIDAMLADPDSIARESLRAKIVEGGDRLRKNRELIRLFEEPPEDADWNDAMLRRAEPDFDRVRAIATRLELTSILRDLDRLEEPERRFDRTPKRAAAQKERSGKKNGEPDSGFEQMELF